MQSPRRLVILLLAGLIIAFMAIVVRNRLSHEETTANVTQPVETQRVLVAKHDIAPGTFVQSPQDIDWEVLKEEVPGKEMLIQDGSARLEDFNGAVARRALRAGERIPQMALMKAGEGGFLSAVLEPGMRAVTIGVTATSGAAGFITPGDRVDLIVTHRIKPAGNGEASGGNDMILSETFVRDIRVVAVDQMLDNPENKAILAKTITVEVTPQQAEQISVAGEMGKISLSLRSLANGQGQSPVDTATRDSDVVRALDRGDIAPRVRVIRGEQSETLQLQ